MQLLDSVELGLQRNIGERYAVRSSMGCGGWAKVPWLAVSIPPSRRSSLYLQYLPSGYVGRLPMLRPRDQPIKEGIRSCSRITPSPARGRVRTREGTPSRRRRVRYRSQRRHPPARATGLGRDYEQGCVIARIYEHGVPLQEATARAGESEAAAHTHIAQLPPALPLPHSFSHAHPPPRPPCYNSSTR